MPIAVSKNPQIFNLQWHDYQNGCRLIFCWSNYQLCVSVMLQTISRGQKPDNLNCVDGLGSRWVGNSSDRFILSLDEWVTELRDVALEAWDSMVLWFHWFTHTHTHTNTHTHNMSHPALKQTCTKQYKSTHTHTHRWIGWNLLLHKSTVLGGSSHSNSDRSNLIWLTTNSKIDLHVIFLEISSGSASVSHKINSVQ